MSFSRFLLWNVGKPTYPGYCQYNRAVAHVDAESSSHDLGIFFKFIKLFKVKKKLN